MEIIDYRNYCASSENTIHSIAELLDKSKLKTLYITSANNKLIGSITDGDLRRAVIRGIPLDQNVTVIMNANPKYVREGVDEKNIAQELIKTLNLSTIPVVDENIYVVGIITPKNRHFSKRMDNPIVIMAGGFGSRLMPLTEETPKPMLKVGGRPILELIIDQFVDQGFHDFYISVYYLADQIKNYFKNGSAKNISIKYLEENNPMGTAGGLSLIPKPLSNLPYIIANGDVISAIDYQTLAHFHKKKFSVATMATQNLEMKVPFGVIETDKTKLIGIKEKPSLDIKVNAGIYMLNPNVIANIKNEAVNITDVFISLLHQNENVHCFSFMEHWTDVGHYEDLKRAQSRFEKNPT